MREITKVVMIEKVPGKFVPTVVDNVRNPEYFVEEVVAKEAPKKEIKKKSAVPKKASKKATKKD